MNIKPGLAIRVVEDIYNENPLIVEDAIRRVEKPDAHFKSLIFLFPLILEKFCELKQYPQDYFKGVNIGGQKVAERVLFISVVLKLFSPGVFKTAYKTEEGNRRELKPLYNIEELVRFNLAVMLECNEQWISQRVTDIAFWMLNRNTEFRDQVLYYENYMKENIKVKVIEPEPEVNNLELFQ